MKNKLNDIIKNIIDNKGGNLSKNMELLSYNNGYMVSIKDLYIIDIFNIIELKKIIKKEVKKLLNNQVLGFWIDNKKLYIDRSININDKEEAIKEGLKNNQLAIYDIKENKTIYIKKLNNSGVVNE